MAEKRAFQPIIGQHEVRTRFFAHGFASLYHRLCGLASFNPANAQSHEAFTQSSCSQTEAYESAMTALAISVDSPAIANGDRLLRLPPLLCLLIFCFAWNCESYREPAFPLGMCELYVRPLVVIVVRGCRLQAEASGGQGLRGPAPRKGLRPLTLYAVQLVLPLGGCARVIILPPART